MFSSLLISGLGGPVGLAIRKILPYFLAVLAVVVLAWFIYDKGYDRGVHVTEIKYQKAIEIERHRQIEANNEALQAALERQRELEKLLDKRDEEITDLLLEGQADPDASRRAIGADSVLRLNRVR